MPTYEVTDPESGTELELEGDKPPTPSALDEIFKPFRKGRIVSAGNELAKAGVGGIGDVLKAGARVTEGMPFTGMAPSMPFRLPEPVPRNPVTFEEKQAALESNPIFQAGNRAQQAGETYVPNPKYRDSILSTAARMAGGFMPILATGPAAPLTAGLKSGEDVRTEAYQKLKDSGLSDQEASEKANAIGAGAGALSGITFGLVPAAGKSLGQKLASKVASEVAKKAIVAGTEGATFGAVDRAVQDTLAKATYKPEMTAGEIAKDVVSTGAALGALGGVAGGGLGKLGESVERSATLRKAENELANAKITEDLNNIDQLAKQAADPLNVQEEKPFERARTVSEYHPFPRARPVLADARLRAQTQFDRGLVTPDRETLPQQLLNPPTVVPSSEISNVRENPEGGKVSFNAEAPTLSSNVPDATAEAVRREALAQRQPEPESPFPATYETQGDLGSPRPEPVREVPKSPPAQPEESVLGAGLTDAEEKLREQGHFDRLVEFLQAQSDAITKYGQSGVHSATGVIPAYAYKAGLETAIAALKGGKKIAGALDEAVAAGKAKAKDIDEAAFRAALGEALGVVRPTVPASPVQSQKSEPGTVLEKVDRVFSGEAPKKERTLNPLPFLRRHLVTANAPLGELERGVLGDSAPKHSLADTFDLLPGSRGKADADVRRFDAALKPHLDGVPEQDFNRYMFLKRAEDRLSVDPKDRSVGDFTPDQVHAGLEELHAQVGPTRFAKLEAAGNEFQNQMDQALRRQVDSGRLSEDAYNAIKDKNKFYAPFMVMEHIDRAERGAGTGKGIDTTVDFTKRIKGIKDPEFELGGFLPAARAQIQRSRILAEKNLAMQKLADVATKDAEGKFISRIGDDANPAVGKEAVNVFRDGKIERYQVDKTVAEAIKRTGPEAGGILLKAASAASVPFRYSATAGNLGFQAVNLPMDLARQSLVSKYGLNKLSDAYRFPMQFLQGFYASIEGNVPAARLPKSNLYQQFLESGAARSTVQHTLTPELLRAQDPGIAKSFGKSVVSTVAGLSNALEETTKIVALQRAMDHYGVTRADQLPPEAITEIRRFGGSPDFSRQGSTAKEANIVLPFLNARIQGTISDIGRLTGKDGAKAAAMAMTRLGAVVGTPTVALWALNNRPENKQDYALRPQWEKDNYWLAPRYNEDGTPKYITMDDGSKVRDYWRFTKRDIMKQFANTIEGGLNYADSKDPAKVGQTVQTVLEEWSPLNINGRNFKERGESALSGLNPLPKVFIEGFTGRDMFRHRDIVPQKLQNASPENQFTEATPDIYRKLGTQTGISPMRLENVAGNAGLGAATQFLPQKSIPGRESYLDRSLLRRFHGTTATEDVPFRDSMDKLKTEAADTMITRERAVGDIVKGSETPREALGKAVDLARKTGDKTYIERTVDMLRARQSGVERHDRDLLSLPQTQRAEYIQSHLATLGPEQSKAYLQDLARKKILTDKTIEELVRLRSRSRGQSSP